MQISVDLNQKWREVAYFYTMNPDAMAVLLQKVSGRACGFDFFALSCGDLCLLMDNRFPESWSEKYKDITVKDWCKLVNSVKDGINGFAAFLEKTTPPTTQEQRMAQSGLMNTTAEEMILLTMKDFYNLHGLEEAQKMTIYEFYVARKAIYNQRRMEYNMTMAAKLKAKSKI